MKRKIDARRLNCIQKQIIKEVREMTDFIEHYAIRSEGIQPNHYIDMIKDFIEKTILKPAKIL